MLTDIETEKVFTEIPSPFKGVVKEFAVEIGQTVPVGTTLLWIETDKAAAGAAAQKPSPTQPAEQPTKETPAMDQFAADMENTQPQPSAPQQASQPAQQAAGTNGAKAQAASGDMSRMYSPAVRKLA